MNDEAGRLCARDDQWSSTKALELIVGFLRRGLWGYMNCVWHLNSCLSRLFTTDWPSSVGSDYLSVNHKSQFIFPLHLFFFSFLKILLFLSFNPHTMIWLYVTCEQQTAWASSTHGWHFHAWNIFSETKRLLSLLLRCVLVGGSPIVCPCTIARVGSALSDFIRFSKLRAAT